MVDMTPKERRLAFAEAICRQRPHWSGTECQQVLDAVKIDPQSRFVEINCMDLPEGHPMRVRGENIKQWLTQPAAMEHLSRPGRYPMHWSMPSHHHQLRTPHFLNLPPAPPRATLEDPLAQGGQGVGWSDAGSSLQSALAAKAGDDDRVTLNTAATAYCGGRGGGKEWIARNAFQFKKEVPPLKAEPPAKPVLLVPEGCVLVIPDDVQPWEFLGRYDTSQMGKTALVVNRSGYETMQKVDAAIDTAIKTEAAETKRTHAALTFEQPIQSRLGRMAK